MLNRIVIIGRLTRDPELRHTPSGKAVTKFTLAVDRDRPNAQGQKEADFIDVVAWGKQAENVVQYLGKGRLAAVEGRLQIRPYEAQDGTKRKAAEVVASAVQFLDFKKDGAGPVDTIDLGSEVSFDDDDVPF